MDDLQPPRRIPFDTSNYLDMVFHIDLDAWSPRKLVYRDAVAFAEYTGSRMPSPTEVYAALRARGFRQAKRRGIWGFVGIRTSGPADQPRVQPAGTESAYRHRHDRTDAAQEAAYVSSLYRKLGGRPGDNISPWFLAPWTSEERDETAAQRMILAGRHPGRPRLRHLPDQPDPRDPSEQPGFRD